LNKKFLIGYINKTKKSIIIYLCAVLVFSITSYLYNLPFGAIFYPIIIFSFISILIMTLDVKKEYRRYKNTMNRLIYIDDYHSVKSIDYEIDLYQKALEDFVSKYKKVKEESAESYSETFEYFTIWAHQIKTPIASMKLQLASSDDLFSKNLEMKLNQIESYVEMVINYIKLNDDGFDFIFEEKCLDDILKEVIRQNSNDFIYKKIKLDYKEINKNIMIDEKWFVFVLNQIISNSIKYTNKGTISIYVENDMLCIKDTGIGINSNDLPRVFEKGYSGFNGRSNKKASGIGLYISKKILDKMNIDIKIESKVNKGTCVYLDVFKKIITE